jgi:uncharacterized protein YhhL (DUF1145 family)
MIDLLVKVTRTGVIVFWIAMILSLVSVVPEPYGQFIVWLGCLVLVVHLIQYLFVKSKVTLPDGSELSFVKTMLFGFTHWLPMVVNGRGSDSER